MGDNPNREPTPNHGQTDNPFDNESGYSGQDYHRDRERALVRRDPPGGEQPNDSPAALKDANDPPEAGRRASHDPATGEVHGSGSGAGGGNPGEDYDSDPMAGSGYPQTGVDGEASTANSDEDG